jgi:hypothetical protein
MEPLKEINLDNPIFVVYINVDGYAANRAHEIVERYKNNLNYTNCNFWFIAVKNQPTKIELSWKGSSLENSSNTEVFKKLNQKISKIVEMLSDGFSDQALKQKLREFALNDVLGDE